jgi:Tol biopolymer transport system component
VHLYVYVYVMEANGKNPKRLCEGTMPVWSADGKKLLYTVCKSDIGSDNDEMRLFVMDANGRHAKPLIRAAAGMGAWSPDGQRIAYVAEAGDDQTDSPGQGDLFVMNADGSHSQQLTRTKEVEIGPQWSADGRRIFFTRFPQIEDQDTDFDKGEVFVIDADGKNLRQLTNNRASDVLSGSGFWAWVFSQLGPLLAHPNPL